MLAGRNVARWALPVIAIAMSATAASAHHPMGGSTPTTLMQGLLSGIGHPILGLDHFAFVIGIGFIAGISGLGIALPALFVAAMTAGLSLHIAGTDLPYAEFLVPLSVIALGAAVWRREGTGTRSIAIAFAAAGLFHGFALAETAIGAEATPLAAYIIGLCVTQLSIAFIAWQLAGGQTSRSMANGADASATVVPVYVRLAGIAIAAVGIGHAVIAARTLA